jgi:hypothetical protein
LWSYYVSSWQALYAKRCTDWHLWEARSPRLLNMGCKMQNDKTRTCQMPVLAVFTEDTRLLTHLFLITHYSKLVYRVPNGSDLMDNKSERL